MYENNTNKDIVLNFDIECHYKEFDHYVDYVWFFDQGSENLNDPNDKDLQTDGDGWATWGTFNMDNVEAVTVEPNYDELNRIILAVT